MQHGAYVSVYLCLHACVLLLNTGRKGRALKSYSNDALFKKRKTKKTTALLSFLCVIFQGPKWKWHGDVTQPKKSLKEISAATPHPLVVPQYSYTCFFYLCEWLCMERDHDFVKIRAAGRLSSSSLGVFKTSEHTMRKLSDQVWLLVSQQDKYKRQGSRVLTYGRETCSRPSWVVKLLLKDIHSQTERQQHVTWYFPVCKVTINR